MKEIEKYQGPVIEQAPESGIRVVDLEARAAEGRKRAARVFGVFPGNGKGALKAHLDPFDTAIEAEVA